MKKKLSLLIFVLVLVSNVNYLIPSSQRKNRVVDGNVIIIPPTKINANHPVIANFNCQTTIHQS